MTNAEKQSTVMRKVGDHLAEYLEKNHEVTAAFKPCRVTFDVYGTENRGMMQLTHIAAGELSLQLGVFRAGTDRLYSNFIYTAAVDEMIRYLRSPESCREWMEPIKHLSDRVDDYWD